MQILGRDILRAFIEKWPDSKGSLMAWLQIMETNDFKHLPILKQTFGSADYVKPQTVFNVAGNKYRLIALIQYSMGLVKIENILTHAEYDKGKWRK